MKTLSAVLTAAVAVAALSTAASAQDYRQRPTYGQATLRTGFLPDPHVRQLQSGGPIDATRLGNGCNGMVANAPDYRIQFTAGRLPLTISATAQGDTTLVINGPDGRWYCNDDSNGLNPSVTFRQPRSGQYDVWVGTYGSQNLINTRLAVSEIGRR